MSETAAARRYAEALADVAFERGQTIDIQQELGAFADLFTRNDELRDTFSSPVIPQRQKRKVLDAVIELTRPGDVTTNLLRLLLRNNRLHHIKAVDRAFRDAVNRREGVVPAEFTTATPIDQKDQQLLVRQVEEVTGKRVEPRFNSDPALIGGVITRVGSVVYDGSIRTRLETIKNELKSEGTTS
ncbi:MAG TPA: ATP synthase F1 subunit delta [Blastocatellia bacterium]|nr:ATP synthase F1 subunit delta [Blastocatellia bacterium]